MGADLKASVASLQYVVETSRAAAGAFRFCFVLSIEAH
jgi:hypothetical protein